MKCATFIYIGQAKFQLHTQAPEYTDVIILFHVIVHPLPSLTIKEPELIVFRIDEKLIGRFIFSVAFLFINHVHGLNRICHWEIHIEFGRSHDRKF